MLWRRVWQGGALLAGALLAVLAVTAVPGSVALSERPTGAEPWLARCAQHEPRPDRLLLARCARVTGRVLTVRREGTGTARDTHLLVTSRLHLFVVKLEGAERAPGVGSYATFEGALVRASNGLREVDAWEARG